MLNPGDASARNTIDLFQKYTRERGFNREKIGRCGSQRLSEEYGSIFKQKKWNKFVDFFWMKNMTGQKKNTMTCPSFKQKEYF